MENRKKELLLENLEETIKKRDFPSLREYFEEYPEIDIADTVDRFENIEDVITIFRVVKSEHTAELFTYLSSDVQENLVNAMNSKELFELMEASYSDDIADFVQDMPANLVSKVLSSSSKETRSDVNKLLNYKDNTAGSIMTTEFLSFFPNQIISDTIKLIREKGKDAETVYTIFVRDEKRNFLGTVDLDDLIFALPEQTLESVMNTSIAYVNVNEDQEQVANKFKRYNLNSMAVLNEEDKLIGIITIDDIVDVIDKETSEDIAFQAGVTPLKDSYMEIGVWRMALKCIPWLIILLILGVFSSMVLSVFQDQISAIPVLTAFIPVIMDTGGNAGSQTSSVIVRSLALDELKPKDYLKVCWKEVKISLIVGLLVSIFAFVWFLIEMSIGLVNYDASTIQQKLLVATLVSITLFFTVFLSKLVGCLLPLIAKKLNKDPALMSGPFVTTIVDVCSLLIYFGVCVGIFHLL